MTSPVASSMTSLAATLPTRSVTSTARRSTFESLQLLDGELGELAVLLDQDLARVRVADVAAGALAGEQVVLDRLRVLLVRLEVDGLGVVVVVEQLLGRVAEGAQQHRRVQLAAAVDADVEEVLGVELEVEPRAAVGDDAGAVEQLARRVRLALVVIVEDARAAVQLADDDALGAVDDEGPVVRHERDLAEEDLLLLDVADRLRPGLLVGVPDDQAHDDLDRRREGHAALAALVDVVLGLVERVRHELQRRRLREVLDRKHALEDALKAHVLALVEGDVLLQELLVALLLDVDQVRDVDDLRDLREGLPRPEVVLDHRRRHLDSSDLPAAITTNGRSVERPPLPSKTGTVRPRICFDVEVVVRCSTYRSYLTSTFAPASVSFFLMVSASALTTPSLTVLGAPSTRSLASLRPRLVTSRTALMTPILLAPASVRTTVNSVCSAAGAAAPPPAAARRSRGHGDRGRLDAPLVLELLRQRRQIQHGHLGKKIDNLLLRHIGHFNRSFGCVISSSAFKIEKMP